MKEKKVIFNNRRLLSYLAPVFLSVAVLLWGVAPVHCAVIQKAVVTTVAPDYSSGAHSVVSVDPVGGPRTYANDLDPTISDITTASYENSFYILERTGRNNVTKYNIDNPAQVIWQWSTEGSETNSNPHELVFESEQKAYLLRYGSNNAWIVNPSATVEADFKIGELDLSAYGFEGNVPGMHSGVIADGKLFITLQRFDATWTPQTAYVAVFDVSTNTEIDTGKGSGDMLGIPLPIKNPGAIQYLAENKTVYVQGSGHFFGTLEYSSGIAAINPSTYDVSMVLDDGDETDHPYGFIVGMAILSPTKGYFVGYAGWGDNTLYTFDPSDTSPVGAAIGGFEHIQIAGMESGVYFDQNNFLWVCNQTTATVDILNTTTDLIDESVGTNLNPSKVVFCDYSPPPPPPDSQTAVVATVAPDYSSGAHSIIHVDPVGGPRTFYNDLSPTISDITVSAYYESFFILERTGKNNVTKFNINNASEVIWQWSTEGNETNSNPHDLVFESEQKAYLLRYGCNNAWIVNPSATVGADFKIGELDLSAYGFEGNAPGMHSGVIADGKLFITLQRFDATWTPQTAYVAVFDVSSNTEIDTGKGSGDMLGIPLPIKNPGAIQYLAENKTVYVQGSGHFFGTLDYSSGIAAISPSTYDVLMVLDDGDETDHPYGFIVGMAILSPTKGYFVGYAGWGDNTLYTFDPSDPSPVGAAIGGLEHIQIAGMESGVYFDRNNFLWVCNQTTATVDILNTTTDLIDESVGTNLNPSKVVFCVEASPPPPPPPPSGGGGGGCFIDSAAGSGFPIVPCIVILSLIIGLCLAARARRGVRR